VIESLDSLVGPATVGNDAGWTLAFHKENPAENWRIEPKPYLVLGRDDYYAEIEAALPGDYSGGKYAFVIEGMTDAHYRKIDDDDVVRLYLYWRDTNATPAGYLASVGGLTDQLNEFAVEALRTSWWPSSSSPASRGGSEGAVTRQWLTPESARSSECGTRCFRGRSRRIPSATRRSL
jgi:hypothetical protein